MDDLIFSLMVTHIALSALYLTAQYQIFILGSRTIISQEVPTSEPLGQMGPRLSAMGPMG